MLRKYHFPLRDEVHLGEVQNGLKYKIDKINIFFSKIVWEIVVGWLVLGSLVSKDGRSDISRILMPSPSHCRVMSQDSSSQSRYPPP